MRKELMNILVCPTDKSELKLTVVHDNGGDILAGKLTCLACGITYEIRDGVPDLLPAELRS